MRYTRDVGPGDSGVRITLRRHLDGGGTGDLLGDLLSWQDGVVRLRDRHGTEHAVAEHAVMAAKRIPPPPARRS